MDGNIWCQSKTNMKMIIDRFEIEAAGMISNDAYVCADKTHHLCHTGIWADCQSIRCLEIGRSSSSFHVHRAMPAAGDPCMKNNTNE
jgi:hypothetical protein